MISILTVLNGQYLCSQLPSFPLSLIFLQLTYFQGGNILKGSDLGLTQISFKGMGCVNLNPYVFLIRMQINAESVNDSFSRPCSQYSTHLHVYTFAYRCVCMYVCIYAKMNWDILFIKILDVMSVFS